MFYSLYGQSQSLDSLRTRHILTVNATEYIDLTLGGGESFSLIHKWRTKKDHLIEFTPGIGFAGVYYYVGDLCSNETKGYGIEGSMKVSISLHKIMTLDITGHVTPYYGYTRSECPGDPWLNTPPTVRFSQRYRILGGGTLGASVYIRHFVFDAGLMVYPEFAIIRGGIGYILN